jgi:hypothetical protein
MHTSRRDFTKAETEYRKAYEFAPDNSMIVAGGANAAIEAHQFPLAGEWLSHASAEMLQDPYVMREKERYLTWTEKYQESADLAQEVFLRVCRVRNYEPTAKFRTWLFHIATNLAINWVRDRKSESNMMRLDDRPLRFRPYDLRCLIFYQKLKVYHNILQNIV